VNLYGTPPGRRVETDTTPLVTEGKVPWKRIDDATMLKGEKTVEQYGTPPRSTSVRRRVFAPDGTLMYDTTWRSYYVGEPTVVRIGTKPRPKKHAKAPAEGTRTTTPVDTGATTSQTTDATAPAR
jgi:uncharacterized protein YabE (DUF348 family)